MIYYLAFSIVDFYQCIYIEDENYYRNQKGPSRNFSHSPQIATNFLSPITSLGSVLKMLGRYEMHKLYDISPIILNFMPKKMQRIRICKTYNHA